MTFTHTQRLEGKQMSVESLAWMVRETSTLANYMEILSNNIMVLLSKHFFDAECSILLYKTGLDKPSRT